MTITVPVASLILPLLTSGAAWAIAVWALKQNDPLTLLVRALTGPEPDEAAKPALSAILQDNRGNT